MALIINTQLENEENGYLLDAKSVKGSYIVVSGIGSDTKENLPSATIVTGTLVYVTNENKTYRYIDTEWQIVEADYSELEARVSALEEQLDGVAEILSKL